MFSIQQKTAQSKTTLVQVYIFNCHVSYLIHKPTSINVPCKISEPISHSQKPKTISITFSKTHSVAAGEVAARINSIPVKTTFLLYKGMIFSFLAYPLCLFPPSYSLSSDMSGFHLLIWLHRSTKKCPYWCSHPSADTIHLLQYRRLYGSFTFFPPCFSFTFLPHLPQYIILHLSIFWVKTSVAPPLQHLPHTYNDRVDKVATWPRGNATSW